MRLVQNIFEVLYDELLTKFIKDTISQGEINPHNKDSLPFWRFEVNKKPLFLTLLKAEKFMTSSYLRKLKYAANLGEAGKMFVTVGRDNLFIETYLKYLKYGDGDAEKRMHAFLDTLVNKGISPADIELQKKHIGLGNVRFSKRTPVYEHTPHIPSMSSPLKLFKAKAPFLENSNFWFFFYGYDLFQGTALKDGKWPLIRLLLTFKHSDGLDIVVTLTNTGDSEHHNYIGKTEFDNSSDSVLVITCRTDPGSDRLLTIMLHVGNATGSIFLGQYLHYQGDGRIISGNLVVQRIPKGRIPKPKVIRVPELTGENKVYKSSYQGVDKSILQYLHNKKINFRRNPLRVGHDLPSLAGWLATYNQEAYDDDNEEQR